MAHGEIPMTREEMKRKSICLTKGNFGKPDLNQVEVEGRSLMIKDVGRKKFFLRWTLGLWLIHKEWKIYSLLKGVHNVPQAIERMDRFAFVMDFVPGSPIRGWVDYGGLLKLKKRVSPHLMTSEEISFLKRFNWIRKLWIFN